MPFGRVGNPVKRSSAGPSTNRHQGSQDPLRARPGAASARAWARTIRSMRMAFAD